ncbi:MAG TPA: PP2C family protein-serine/threonine phosphatase [Planctomycetota bacterium]|nr:PP2C family protein-serine/threonine phosphatase [Planctomycetota bacterium]
MEPSEEEPVVQTPAYAITRRRSEEFLHIRITGRFAEGLLDDLRSKVFLYKCHYAVDVSGLAGVNAALVRELQDTAVSFRSGEKRLVLVNPPEALRSLVLMGGGKSALEIVMDEEQLGAPPPAAGDGGAHTLRELERLRKEFQSNRHWQFIDREGCWICPYCAAILDEVRLTSPLSISSATVERAYRHLWSKCPEFKPSAPRPRPLQELQETLRRANGEKMIVPRGRMVRLESELASLKDKTQEMEDSVRRASERQRRLLPAKAPQIPGTEIDLIYRPAAVVSGDFYDFVPLGDGRMAFLVGDVSGHGIEAGIVMGMAKKVLSIRLQDYRDPIQAVVRTNQDVDRELGRVSFVTAFVAVFDPGAGTLSCVRAGHNPPLLYHPERPGRCLQLKPRGMGLGITGCSTFAPQLEALEVPLKVGDVLLLYTDGLVEAADPKGQQFGIERLVQVLTTSYGYPPALVLSELAGALDGFTGNSVPEDDVTAVCVRFL